MRIKLLGLLVFLSSSWVTADINYTLTYHQKELQSEAGVAAVYQRIEQAAAHACPDHRRISGLRGVRERRACMQDVIGALTDKVSHTGLSEYAAGQRPKPLVVARH